MTFIINPDAAGGVIRFDSKGRLMVPPDQREALLDVFERSGQSGVAFCRQHGLKYPTFATWVQKRRRQPSTASFPPKEAPAQAFAEVVLEPSPSKIVTALPGLSVTLADGTRIDIGCSSQLPLAVALIQSLAGLHSC